MTDWYTVTGAPANNSAGSSATIRAEFVSIAAAFSKMAGYTGLANQIVVVNGGGTGHTTVSAIGVTQGGTGFVTATAGGILLGNGASAITVTAKPALGEVLVGQAGLPVLQSGATLLATLGVNNTHTGDVTGGAVLTIANSAVTYAKMQNVSATARVLGRITAGAGVVEELTAANLITLLLAADGSLSQLDADFLDGQHGAFYQDMGNAAAGTLAVARGGTGVTAATGGGTAVVLHNSPTFTGTVSGAAITLTGALTCVGISTSGAFTGTTISCTGDITGNTSDGRLKKDWAPLFGVLDLMQFTRVGTYKYNELARSLNPQFDNEERRLGLVAQEIQSFWPEAVAPAPFDTDADGNSISGENYLTIRYEMLVPVLWQAVKDLRELLLQ